MASFCGLAALSLFFACISLALLTTLVDGSHVMLCYAKGGNPKPERIDADLCTHLIIINNCTLDQNGLTMPGADLMRRYVKLKHANPMLKILISFTPQNPHISALSMDQNRLGATASFIRDYLIENLLDGFDVDWAQFPVWSTGARITDKQGFTNTIKTLREAFNSAPRRLLLTAAVCAAQDIIEKAYEPGALDQYLDYVQIMNYDFHLFSPVHPFVGFNAPLHATPYEVLTLGRINSEYATRYWLSLGISPSKLIFGIPVYGTGFELLSKHIHFNYAPATGTSKFGSTVGYKKVCEFIKKPAEFKYRWDRYAATPYIQHEREWLSVEDKFSVAEKAQFARTLGVGGVMVFALDSDDYANRCGEGTYPLTRTIRDVMTNGHTAAMARLLFGGGQLGGVMMETDD